MEEIDERISAIIAKYLAGEASPEETGVLTKWLEEDAGHARIFARMADMDYAARPPFPPEGIPVEKARLKTMHALRKEERGIRRRRFFHGAERVAAVLFLPLLLAVAYLIAEKGKETEAVAWQTVTTPFRTNTLLELPDGSKVWLNGGGTLKYPLTFGKSGRDIYLSGEAYFDVESDKRNPFSVHTGDITVTATGTEFNVNAFPNDNTISVTMVDGIVDIDMKGVKRRIAPGENVSFDSRANTCTVERTDPEKICAWRNGRIIFDNDNLGSVFHRLGQIYNVEFSVCDPAVDKYVYHAVFTDETLPEILDMLSISAPIRYEIIKNSSPDPDAPKQFIRVYGK